MSLNRYSKSLEHRIKLSIANKGKHLTEETKKKISIANKGKTRSYETKQNMSKAQKGIRKSQDHKNKLAQTHIGLHPSEETRKKMSLSRTGKKHKKKHPSRIMSVETRLKISNSQKGRPSPLKGRTLSEETKTKMSIAKMGIKNTFFGKHHSEETKSKLSIAGKGNKRSLGCHPSEYTRKKLVAVHLGKHTAKLGTKLSPENIKKLSDYQKKFCSTKEGKDKIKKMQSAIAINISKVQRQMFHYVKKEINDAVLQYPIWTGKTWRFADVAIPEFKIDVEFDGEYWHEKSKDDLRDIELQNIGWKTIRINEYELAFLLGETIYSLRRRKVLN